MTQVETIDALLVPFIDAEDETEADRFLACILDEHTDTIVERVISARFGRYPSIRDSQHFGELRSQVFLSLVSRLRQCRANPAGKAISSWRGYVTIATSHACDEYLRHKYPNRYRLKSKLRYLFTHKSGIGLWESATGELVCGLVEWRERIGMSQASHASLLENPGDVVVGQAEVVDARSLLSLLERIFKRAGGPLRLDDLVAVVAHLCQITDPAPLSTDDPHAATTVAANPHSNDPSVRLAARERLVLVWKEICALPVNQRVALVFSLADIALLPMTGVASIRQIAAIVEWEPLEFAAQWRTLPLEDEAIATLLGVTRQQVINMRKSARERLARRMRAWV